MKLYLFFDISLLTPGPFIQNNSPVSKRLLIRYRVNFHTGFIVLKSLNFAISWQRKSCIVQKKKEHGFLTVVES